LLAVVLPAAGVSQARLAGSFRFDLAAGSIDGKPILGRSLSAVTAALGTPSARNLHRRYGSISYGPREDAVRPLTISFKPRGSRLIAWSLYVTSPAAAEVRAGEVLRLQPRRIQRAIARAYRAELRLEDPYRCSRKPPRCRGEFEGASPRLDVAFGLVSPGASSRRYIAMYA
jgi:hypothetical protein